MVFALDGGSDASRAGSNLSAGVLAWAQGDLDEGLARLDASVTLAERAGDVQRLADCRGVRGLVGLIAGVPDAVADLEASLDGYRQVGSESGVALTLIRLGIAASAAGDLDRAAALFDDSIVRYEARGSVWGVATARCNRADVHRDRGNWREAAGLYAESLAGYRAVDAGWYVACALAGVANSASGLGRHEPAAMLYGAVDALLDELASPMHPLDRAAMERGRRAARRALGGRFDSRAAEGRARAGDTAAIDSIVDAVLES
jgi:tetratricopeptide (TPR) repeat protein